MTALAPAYEVGTPAAYEIVPKMEPGSPDWLKAMSASKVAAILGLSPYESRFALWHRMNGTIGPQAEKSEMRRGHYMEPGVAAWFADQHPELEVLDVKVTYRNLERPWMVASPDRMLLNRETGEMVTALECKTDGGKDWEWGPTGSDQIPLGYRCQVEWSMDVLGLDYMHVAVLTPYLDLREYVIHRDEDDAALLRRQAAAFMASLGAGVSPDPLDGSDVTYQAVRDLAPGIRDDVAEIGDDLATRWVEALVAEKEATTALSSVKSELAHAMGEARTAINSKRTLATRQSRNGGTPYLVTGRGLIAKEKK